MGEVIMGFKTRTFIICSIITGLLFSLMLLLLSSSGRFIAQWFPNKGLMIAGCFGMGLLLGFITNVLITLFSKNVKGQNAIMEEQEKNGYSDRYVMLLHDEVERLSSRPLTQISVNYILQLANVYLMKEDVNAAITTVNLLNPERDKKFFNSFSQQGKRNLLCYYDVQVCICEELWDAGRAERVMKDAMPMINSFYGSNKTLDLLIDEILSIYYIVYGQYGNAMKYADHCLTFTDNRYALFVGNLQKAKIYGYIRDKSSGLEYLRQAESYGQKPFQKDVVEYVRRRYLSFSE